MGMSWRHEVRKEEGEGEGEGEGEEEEAEWNCSSFEFVLFVVSLAPEMMKKR